MCGEWEQERVGGLWTQNSTRRKFIDFFGGCLCIAFFEVVQVAQRVGLKKLIGNELVTKKRDISAFGC